MSIYYNLKINPNENADYNRDIAFEDYVDSPIIEKQSDYSVGIKRFKIPISNVDLYRIYENKELIGILPNGVPRKLNDTNLSKPNSPFDLYSPNSWNSNDVDDKVLTLPHEKATIRGRYLPVRSHSEYANIMTRALVNAHSTFADSRGTLITNEITPTAAVDVVSNNVFTVIAELPAASMTNVHALLTDIEVGVKYWAPDTTSNASNANLHRFSDLQFALTFAGSGGTDTYILGDGLFPDIDSAEKFQELGGATTPNGQTSTNNNAVFVFTPKARKTHLAAQNGSSGWKVSSSAPVREFSTVDYTDMDCLYKNYNGHTISLLVRDKANLSTTFATPAGLAADYQTKMVGYIKTQECDIRDLSTGQSFTQSSEIKLPKFIYNNTTNEIEFHAEKEYLNMFYIWFNSGLLASTNFKAANYPISQSRERRQYDAQKLYLQLFKSFVYAETTPTLNEICGSIIAFPTNNDPATDASPIIISYSEQSSSDFKRNFVYGLVITTNRLGVDGEYDNGGSKQTKVLTDFVIDPSRNIRDYLVYQPSGGSVRYYQLKSPHELSAIDAQVFYTDMNGNVRRLQMNNNMAASIKLEFRPNSMIYNY